MDMGYIDLHCKVCSASFSGPIPARQHYESAEHKRKEALAQSAEKDIGLTYCSVCNKRCDTLQQLQLHQKSPRHLAMVEKKRGLESQQTYHQAAVTGGNRSTANDKEYEFDGCKGFCYLCRIDLTSASHAKDHINGRNHQKKKIQSSALKLDSCTGKIGNQSVHLDPNHLPSIGSRSTSESRQPGTSAVSPLATTANTQGVTDNLSCSVCKVTFTGPQCAQQHFSSSKHMKKVQQSSALNLPAPVLTDNTHCNICNVNFSGPDNAHMHYTSDKHKKKIEQFQEGKPRYFCELCKVSFTGPENQAIHNQSDRHKKNVKLDEMRRRGEEVPMSCNACGTHFTGLENAEAHFQSKKHTANMRNMQLRHHEEEHFTSEAPPTKIYNFLQEKNVNTNTPYKQEPLDKAIAITTDDGHTEFIAKPFPVEEEDVQPSSQTNVKTLDDSRPDGQTITSNNAPNGPAESSSNNEDYSWSSYYRQLSDESNEEQSVTDDSPVCFVKNDLFSSGRGRGRGFLSLDLSACQSHLGRVGTQNNQSTDLDQCTDDKKMQSKLLHNAIEREFKTAEALDYNIKQNIGPEMNTQKEMPPFNMNCNGTGLQAGTRHASGPDLDNEYVFDPTSDRGRCLMCNIELTSRNHMLQHTTGKNHLRACAVWKQISSSGCEEGNVCTICRVTFTGADNRKQHLESAKHLSKAQQLKSGSKDFFCQVCTIQCTGEQSYQQHLAGAQHRKVAGNQFVNETADTIDKTVWFHCNVCNCSLNSAEQLNAHKVSPRHLAKLQKEHPQEMPKGHFSESLQAVSVTRNDLDVVTDPFGSQATRNLMSPLASFLSEELFPAEFLPEDVKLSMPAKQRFDPVITSGPLPSSQRKVSYVLEDSSCNDGAGHGQNSSSRSSGTDIAFATRSRGNKVHQSPSENASGGREISTPVNQAVNPYAATHAYYCHTCKSPMNTRESYESHLKGKRHLGRVSTEPAPLRKHYLPQDFDRGYVPYSKTQPRNYQLELYRKAMDKDTLCFLPTGTGKTLVSVLTISMMLEKCPSRNVLFLVDKVLLVLQQSRYIQLELQDSLFYRTNYTSKDCSDLEQRQISVAAVCMGQQNTNGIPLWKHDVVVVTAAFCQNLLDKSILRWEDFSLVVFDEAHHCEKAHPFNSLLQNYHKCISSPNKRPKVLGLTASPAGKSDVNKTLQMLKTLVQNMGGVRMGIVEEHGNVEELNSFQSNAKLIIRPQVGEEESLMCQLKKEFCVYLLHCILKLLSVSNIKHYLGNLEPVKVNMVEEDVRQLAESFVEKHLDTIQSSLHMIDSSGMAKVEFSLLTCHIRDICMALNSLEEGGPSCALEEVIEMEATDQNFAFASRMGLPCGTLHGLLSNNMAGERQDSGADLHIRRLVDELTDVRGLDITTNEDHRPISLVLVKQRATAHKISKVLQRHERMRSLDLKTAVVVGHGSSGSEDRGMSVPQQKRVLDDIKLFKYQVIVATSVAEEGVDWPDCERVISLYPPSTVTALVQMRGRARKKNSKFVVLCSSQEEEEKLRDILKREENMKVAATMLSYQSQ